MGGPPAWVPQAATPAASETTATRHEAFTRAWTRRASRRLHARAAVLSRSADEYGKRDYLGFQAMNWCTA
jgi:hypothetical protein